MNFVGVVLRDQALHNNHYHLFRACQTYDNLSQIMNITDVHVPQHPYYAEAIVGQSSLNI